MVITVRCKLRFAFLYFIDECNFIGLVGFFMAMTAECECRMHLSKRERRWHRCFIRIEVASKHFLRSILVSILINIFRIVVIEIRH